MNFNLAVILSETAKASPGKPVAFYDGGRLTYAELDALSDRCCAGRSRWARRSSRTNGWRRTSGSAVTGRHSGHSPCRGKISLRVAMIARSAGSAGS
jgi:hypothetical protein